MTVKRPRRSRSFAWLRVAVDDDALDLDDDELLALPRPACPNCGHAGSLVPRIYGMPSPDDELLRRAEAGDVDVEFAGCIVPVDPLPLWRCRRCSALVARDGALVSDLDD